MEIKMYKPTNSTIVKKPHSLSSTLSVILTKGGAKLPKKVSNFSHVQSGVLLTRKGVEEDEVGKVTTFELGLSIHIPRHIFLQIIASPSLISHGYMLASGIVLVPSRKPLTVQLFKFREGPDLELPYEGIYLLPQKAYPVLYRRGSQQIAPQMKTLEFAQEFNVSSSHFDQEEINTLS